jgi:5-(carboxyamino)imidazole ribonucleotide mutase
MMQMPPGVPVATVGVDNAKNAAFLALEILAVRDENLKNRLKEYRKL